MLSFSRASLFKWVWMNKPKQQGKCFGLNRDNYICKENLCSMLGWFNSLTLDCTVPGNITLILAENIYPGHLRSSCRYPTNGWYCTRTRQEKKLRSVNQDGSNFEKIKLIIMQL